MRERLQKKEEPEAICKVMCDHCMAPDTQVSSPLHTCSTSAELLQASATLHCLSPEDIDDGPHDGQVLGTAVSQGPAPVGEAGRLCSASWASSAEISQSLPFMVPG